MPLQLTPALQQQNALLISNCLGKVSVRCTSPRQFRSCPALHCLDLLQTLLGQVDLSFLAAYAIGMFFAGHMGDRTDLRVFLAAGMVGSGLFCMLFGMVSAGSTGGVGAAVNSFRRLNALLCPCARSIAECSCFRQCHTRSSRKFGTSTESAGVGFVLEAAWADLLVTSCAVQAYLWDIHSIHYFTVTMVSPSGCSSSSSRSSSSSGRCTWQGTPLLNCQVMQDAVTAYVWARKEHHQQIRTPACSVKHVDACLPWPPCSCAFLVP
jgi:hypothetical protein